MSDIGTLRDHNADLMAERAQLLRLLDAARYEQRQTEVRSHEYYERIVELSQVLGWYIDTHGRPPKDAPDPVREYVRRWIGTKEELLERIYPKGRNHGD